MKRRLSSLHYIAFLKVKYMKSYSSTSVFLFVWHKLSPFLYKRLKCVQYFSSTHSYFVIFLSCYFKGSQNILSKEMSEKVVMVGWGGFQVASLSNLNPSFFELLQVELGLGFDNNLLPGFFLHLLLD